MMITRLDKPLLKKSLILPYFLKVTSVIFFASSITCVASERVHYRCYVELEDKSLVVHPFVNTEGSYMDFLEKLPGSIAYTSDGVSGTEIISVKECITNGKTFINKEARLLAEITPM